MQVTSISCSLCECRGGSWYNAIQEAPHVVGQRNECHDHFPPTSSGIKEKRFRVPWGHCLLHDCNVDQSVVQDVVPGGNPMDIRNYISGLVKSGGSRGDEPRMKDIALGK